MIIRKIQPKVVAAKKRVAAYCRVSTQRNEQDESFATQKRYYEEMISTHPDWELVKIYSDRHSATAAKNRPGFQEMLADAEAKKLDIVICKSISRFARNIVDCQKYTQWFSTLGITVIFEEQNIRTDDPTSGFVLSMMSAIAQDESHCIQDVNTEVDIYKRLKRFPMPAREWHHYRVNERINDRGVRIDTELVQQAITCDLLLSDAMTTKAYELTGLENPNSVSQLKTWLDERGISMDTLGKKNVTEMIGELDKNGVDAEAMDMLKLRLQMAKSSVKKYQAAERCVCPDGRARGLFQFYGASRTGRYSGRNIQLQNLPQNHISTLDEARTLVKMGCFDMVESIYGNTPDVLSQLIRTMLIPKEGCEFIVADFSAIEARVLAWEAGEQWVLDAFQNGEDLYCATASQMFHVPVVKHGINGDLRQKGKIATLACGYGGSSGALISMGALQMGLKEEELPEIIDSWREANPKIVQYWWDVEKAAMRAFKSKERQDIGKISFVFYSGTLWMVLPSGRKLAYLKPKQLLRPPKLLRRSRPKLC